MPDTTVTVGSSVGLHARPADIIAEAASAADAPVTLAKPGRDPVDADEIADAVEARIKEGS